MHDLGVVRVELRAEVAPDAPPAHESVCLSVVWNETPEHFWKGERPLLEREETEPPDSAVRARVRSSRSDACEAALTSARAEEER